jgi:hypothetical protein
MALGPSLMYWKLCCYIGHWSTRLTTPARRPMPRLPSGGAAAFAHPRRCPVETTHVAPAYYRGHHWRFCRMPSGLTATAMAFCWLVSGASTHGAHLAWTPGYTICSAPLSPAPLGKRVWCTSGVGRIASGSSMSGSYLTFVIRSVKRLRCLLAERLKLL